MRAHELTVFALAARLAVADEVDERLRSRLDRLVVEIGDAEMSQQVVEIESGRILFARDPDRPLHPASNVKLVTVAAALDRLTPHYRFRTGLHADALEGARIRGNLYLRGFGD